MASVVASVCLFYSAAVSAQSAPPPPPAPPGPVAPVPTLDWEHGALVRDLQIRSNGTASRATRESVRFQLSPFGRRYGAPVDRTFDAWASFDPEAKPGEPDRLWHAWASPHLGWTRRDHPVNGYDGTQGGGAIGVDRRIGDRSVLGVFVHHETANFTMKPVNGSLRSHLDGIGAYGGIALGESVVIDAMILWQSGKTRLREAGATGSYDNQRWSFAANVTGYHSVGPVQVAPSAGFDVSLDRQDAFTDSLGFAYAARSIDTVALTAGLEIGREFAMANGGNMTPFIGAGARYDVMRRDTGAVGATYDPSRLDLSVRLGLRADPTSAVSLSLEMDVSGLARRNQATMGANARLGVRF